MSYNMEDYLEVFFALAMRVSQPAEVKRSERLPYAGGLA